MRSLSLFIVALALSLQDANPLSRPSIGKTGSHEHSEADSVQLELIFRNPIAFSTSTSIVEQVLSKAQNPTVHRHEDDDMPSGFEHLFDRLYQNDFAMSRLPLSESYHKIELLDEESSPLSRRVHFLIQVAYNGDYFCGWQRQPTNPLSVQQTLEDCMKLYPSIRYGEGVNLRVCGRTDAGVHAIGQVCRFRTRVPFDEADLFKHLQSLNSSYADSLRVISLKRVSLKFHPTNTCKCRAYTYLLNCENVTADQIEKLNSMLKELEGKEMNYFGVSYGPVSRKNGKCIMFHSRACFVVNIHDRTKTVCVELVGNRFLRRMVRILVATALRLALLQTSTVMSLHNLILEQDRRLASSAAPPEGLIFVDAMFNEI